MKNKLIYNSINFIIGILNILIIMPVVLAVGLVIVALCAVDLLLFIAFILAVLKIFIPSMIVNFGVHNTILRIMIVCIVAVMGYYLYKLLNVCIQKYLSFLEIYMKKSFTFKFNILRNKFQYK